MGLALRKDVGVESTGDIVKHLVALVALAGESFSRYQALPSPYLNLKEIL